MMKIEGKANEALELYKKDKVFRSECSFLTLTKEESCHYSNKEK